MLRYDAAWLIEQYRDETPAAPGLPYARIGAGPYRVTRHPEPFRLHDVLGLEPRLDYDEPVVRLVSLDDSTTLTVQRAAFSDGVKSNYAMDGERELRPCLIAEYGAKLPPLSDPRLSNGIGTAVIVFDAAGKPYLPRRAPRQSVFPGGFHCTASGEAVWTDAADFDGLFTQNICRELTEEVGMTRDDLDWIRPVAFCREFLRSGKPQFFFAAATRLDPDQLRTRRLKAIERQIAAGRQEILDEVLSDYRPELCTLECIANLTLTVGQA